MHKSELGKLLILMICGVAFLAGAASSAQMAWRKDPEVVVSAIPNTSVWEGNGLDMLRDLAVWRTRS